MSQAIAKETEISLVEHVQRNLPVVDYTAEDVQLIKDTFAKGASDDELKLFLNIAKRKGLDIFSRQIFLVPRWDSKLKREVMTPQTSIDGYRLIADRSERYAPGPDTTYIHDESGVLVAATAHVKKFVHGEWHTISVSAYYAEYVQKSNSGEVHAMWKRMPHVMLSKCAESLALRKAFPAELSGIHTSDEMGQADVIIDVQYEAPALKAKQSQLPPAPTDYISGAEATAGALPPQQAKPNGNDSSAGLAEIIRELLALDVTPKEIQARMQQMTGKSKREELTEAQRLDLIEEFETWANQLDANLKGDNK